MLIFAWQVFYMYIHVQKKERDYIESITIKTENV